MATFYVAESALGTGDGSSAVNAKAMSWLNTAGSWNGATGTTICATATAATIRDEVHFVGTISTGFDWPYPTGVGSAGIRFVFEPNAKFSRPHWNVGRGCAIFWESAAYAKNDVEIDFGLNGCIEATDNGTNLTYQLPSSGMIFQSAKRVTIINPRIYNMFVRVLGTGQGRTSTGIAAQCNSGNLTDLTITGGIIHDCDIGISTNATTAGCARYLIENVEIYNINWGIGCGLASTGATMEDLVIQDCRIHDFANWDTPVGVEGLEDFHHNGIFLYGEPTGENFMDALIQRNVIGPNFGTRATAGVYLSHWTMKGTYIVRNNVLIGAPTNGLVTVGTAVGSHTYVYNNTFISPNAAIVAGGSYAGAGMTVHAKNNLVTGGSLWLINYAANVTVDSDYNLVYGYTAGFPGPVTRGLDSSVGAVPWATWLSTYGQDTHSVIDINPLLDGNGRPETGSPALGAGVDLSASFSDDLNGLARVAPWNIGAYEQLHYPFLLPATIKSTELSTSGAGNFMGFWFKNTSGEPIVITELGRWQRAGNTQVHSLRVYSVTSHLGAATLLGSVSVNCAGGTTNTWLRGALSTPIMIGLGVEFVVGSEEFTGGDTFGNNGGTSFVTSGIGDTWAGLVTSDGISHKGTDSNRGFGPVNFWYRSPEAIWTKSGNIYSTDGSRFSVQDAVNNATAGDIIEIPEGGTFTWGAGGASLSIYKDVTLRGAGLGATLTLSNLSSSGTQWGNGVIKLSAGGKVDNLTITQTGGGNVTAISATGTDGWRVSRVTYNSASGVGYFVYFSAYGLIDNCIINGGAGDDEWIFGRGPDNAWQSPSQKGSANAVYVENCTLGSRGYLDANANANVVVRNCSIVPSGGSIKLDGHGQRTNYPPRSFRMLECYRNNWTTSNSNQTCFEVRGGTGFIWGNTTLDGSIILADYRIAPNGPNVVGDYPLYDQVGTGQDPFPASAAAEPFYLWDNLRGGSRWPAVQSLYGVSMVGLINPDRDYFETPVAFNGTSGVGRGTRAQMLAITPTTNKVGYWVTDEGDWDTGLPAGTSGQLYTWNGSAWVLYYTPYTYPHPLRGSLASPTIVLSPVSQTVTSGVSVTFTCTASGNPAPTYQWRKGGLLISGATSPSYTIVTTQILDAGIYDCVVSNNQGSATSAGATLAVSGTLDTTPPSPNPSVIESLTPDSTTQITATAALSVDVISPPVEYNHSLDGVYAGWQSSRVRVFAGLVPGTPYSFRVKVRDAQLNETTQSAVTVQSTQSLSLSTVSPTGNFTSPSVMFGLI